MTIGTALRAHLLADATITALVVARIYPLRLPQKAVLPSIVLTRVSGLRFGHLRGAGSLARPRYQVDCWAQTHDGATTLGSLCRQRLDGFVGTWTDAASPPTAIQVALQFETELDLFEEDINGGVCRHSADYFLFHQTAGGTL